MEPLGIGELWAVPIHLRITLVENLRRLSQLIVYSRQARARADELADRLLGLSGWSTESMEDATRPLAGIPLTRAFAVQLVQRLRDLDESITPALEWLQGQLGAQGTSPGEVVAEEHNAQGAATATVRNIIISMRWMSSIDWLEFFEDVSLVDEVLRTAPVYPAMDFATRDDYRKQIEVLSRRMAWSEIKVAQEAVRLAENAAVENRIAAPPALVGCRSSRDVPTLPGIPERPDEDPGFFLVSRGRREIERILGFRAPLRLRLFRVLRAHAIKGYLGGIAALTTLQLSGLLFAARSMGAGPWSASSS